MKPIYKASDELRAIEACVHAAFSLCDTDLCAALKIIDELFEGKGVPFLDFCIRECLMFNNRQCKPTEKNVYEWFKSNYKNCLGSEWEIVKLKNHPKHLPDFWVNNGYYNVPVECKLHKFDDAALRQLQRYMKFYGSNRGIAVAHKLSVPLPKNITFVKYE